MVALVVSSLLIRSHPATRDDVAGWLPLVEADVREGSGPLTLVIADRSYEIPTSPSGEGVSTRELLPEGPVITVSGALPFELRMRGETLFAGAIDVSDDGSWLVRPPALPAGHLLVQASADEDAPWVAATAWVPGEVDEYSVYAGLRYDGDVLPVSLEVDSVRLAGGASRVRVESPALRAWLLADYSDSDEWHELFENPGEYALEVGGSTIEFSVVDGVLRTGGPAELDLAGDLVLFADDRPVWGGVVAHPTDVRSWYERFLDFGSEGGSDDTGSNDAAGSSAEARAAIESVQTHVGTYRDDLAAGGGSLDHDQVDYALSDFLPLRERITALRASEPDDLDLAAAAGELDELIALAERFLRGESDEVEALLAPFRAVLRADKLAICLDRPPHEYRYLTSGKREISTPEELAAAPVWYFEGGGTEGGLLLEVSSWSVIGFHFAPDHTLTDRTETSGLGASAPSSAFP
ncbi:hypothetical protein GCM10010988_23130 [Cnuibacter physcomitrellae]|uniref:Uncharacterized protein n=1 Tax=Cnuibacter physcomitrellae TaxID=1619308 RepID=A0A1X9LY42_9MICO|nr:hypothetical protein [Cnuibacter physcomitrellae]ARJ06970.1 hypothetical protein B5808_18365 [Cnuibacter physcomitrellae]GGI39250.1 hypothetical protein GCM10010988_23130 [Cnuibacter physcomitrellae]